MDNNNTLSIIPIGGIGDVTKNMYLYEYKDQILIVDCGLGFADQSMLGVDLLLPDVSYLIKTCMPAGKAKKKIVGMFLTHGHEDHIGALPFVLPQLPEFPIYASPFTATLANEKLKEFGIARRIKVVPFAQNTVQVGVFNASFIRVTHSVPDTTNIFIRTPIGNMYHGSDHKFDDTPFDNNVTDFAQIEKVSNEGILCLLSDCLGSERQGKTPTEKTIFDSFVREIGRCEGRFIVTTYSSNIARVNQIIQASKQAGRKVCFIGRSLIKTKEVAQKLNYLELLGADEISIDQLKNYPDKAVTLIIAGSQGQENSALSRIVNGEHRDVTLKQQDTIVFSADPIPGNELAVYELVDTIAKRDVRVLYSPLTKEFHVSGHGSVDEIKKLVTMAKAKILIPIGGSQRHMVAYRNIAMELGYKRNQILLLDDGQEIILAKDGNVRLGRNIPVKNVYVDEVSGEELENYILRDRQKLSEGGIVIVLSEIDANNGQLVEQPDIIIRGFSLPDNGQKLGKKLAQDIKAVLSGRKGRVTNWLHLRKLIENTTERRIFRELRRNPLVLPIVMEV